MHLILLIITILLFASCGNKAVESKKIDWQEPIWAENADFLYKKHTLCEQQISNQPISIIRFLNNMRQTKAIDFSGQVSEFSIGSKKDGPISSVIYNEFYYQILYSSYNHEENRYPQPEIQGTGYLLSKGEEFKICGDSTFYSSEDLENIALNTSDIITRTYSQIAQVSNFKVEAIKVSIQPKIELKIRQQGGPEDRKQTIFHMVDNAYYSPRDNKIAFLPQSIKNYRNNLVPLWEIPMVASHEYGHHIFRTISKKYGSDKSYQGCFHRNITDSPLSKDRIVSSKFAIDAINEGFSDLIAYYSLTEEESNLSGIDCFEKNREVHSPRFANGELKTFTHDVQKAINSDEYIQRSRDCATPNYQQIHDIGAFFAHNLDSLFSKVLFSKKQKLKTLLNFLQSLKIHHHKIKEELPSEYLFFALTIAYHEAKKEAMMPITQQDCYFISNIFDGYKPENACRFLQVR